MGASHWKKGQLGHLYNVCLNILACRKFSLSVSSLSRWKRKQIPHWFKTFFFLSWKSNHNKYSSTKLADSEFKIGETIWWAVYFFLRLFIILGRHMAMEQRTRNDLFKLEQWWTKQSGVHWKLSTLVWK